MNKKDDRFSFSEHSLQRGLERMLDIKAPYTQEQYHQVKKLITLNMEWSELECVWVLEGWNLVLVIKNDKCVTIAPKSIGYKHSKPVSLLQKSNHKLYMKLGRKHDNGRGFTQ